MNFLVLILDKFLLYLDHLGQNFHSSIPGAIDLFNFIPYFNWILLFAVIFFAYNQFSIFSWLLIGLPILIQFQPDLISFVWYIVLTLVISIPVFRRNLITLPIFLFIKFANLIPNISKTELTVLKSGTVWVDGQLFSGNGGQTCQCV